MKVYGSIGASKEGLEPVDVVDEIILPVRIKKNGVIAFKVRGNSMHPSIVDGSIVLFVFTRRDFELGEVMVVG